MRKGGFQKVYPNIAPFSQVPGIIRSPFDRLRCDEPHPAAMSDHKARLVR